MIEFRCWNVEEKIMHDVAYPTWGGMIEVWRDNKPQTSTQFLSANGPEERGILEQWTGKLDISGIKIFVGDYVHSDFINSPFGSVAGEVQYFQKQSAYVIKDNNGDIYPMHEIHNDEVIGTIHDKEI